MFEAFNWLAINSSEMTSRQQQSSQAYTKGYNAQVSFLLLFFYMHIKLGLVPGAWCCIKQLFHAISFIHFLTSNRNSFGQLLQKPFLASIPIVISVDLTNSISPGQFRVNHSLRHENDVDHIIVVMRTATQHMFNTTVDSVSISIFYIINQQIHTTVITQWDDIHSGFHWTCGNINVHTFYSFRKWIRSFILPRMFLYCIMEQPEPKKKANANMHHATNNMNSSGAEQTRLNRALHCSLSNRAQS